VFIVDVGNEDSIVLHADYESIAAGLKMSQELVVVCLSIHHVNECATPETKVVQSFHLFAPTFVLGRRSLAEVRSKSENPQGRTIGAHRQRHVSVQGLRSELVSA